MKIDFENLWAAVVAEPHGRPSWTVHGPDHWKRVERNACILAARTGAEVTVVRLFAIFHDSKRESEYDDPEHGLRGAEFAASVLGKWFELPDEQFSLLYRACAGHTDGYRHDDPTIGTCWDADRLDLGRVGIVPDPAFMSTGFDAEVAERGEIRPWLHLAWPHLPDFEGEETG